MLAAVVGLLVQVDQGAVVMVVAVVEEERAVQAQIL
jgi:hypothetical protein